jgi:hypothetical protein
MGSATRVPGRHFGTWRGRAIGGVPADIRVVIVCARALSSNVGNYLKKIKKGRLAPELLRQCIEGYYTHIQTILLPDKTVEHQ